MCKINEIFLTFLSLVFISFLFGCTSNHEKERSYTFEIVKRHKVENVSYRGFSRRGKSLFIAGSKGNVSYSNNLGKTWDVFTLPGKRTQEYRDLEVLEDGSILIMGITKPAVIYRKEFLSNSWKEVYSDTVSFFNSMTFSGNKGVVVGDPVDGKLQLLKTVDGGRNWSSIRGKLPETAKTEMGFAASGTSVISEGNQIWLASGGDESRVYFSSNFGETWKFSIAPILHGKGAKGIYSLCFENNILMAVGGDYTEIENREVFAFSKDDGETWSEANVAPNGFRACVTHYSNNVWLCGGTNGMDISTDNGITWKRLNTLNVNTIACFPDGKCWAIGDHGMIIQFKLN